MKLSTLFAVAFSLTALTSSCLTTFPSWADAPNDPVSLETAERVLNQSVEAHGDIYAMVDEIHVAYDGEWGSMVPALQSVLADVEYRQTSRERLVLATGLVEQTHKGPAGTKRVVRTPDTIEVSYNGVPSEDPEVLASAALVADLYSMFLTGPNFIVRRQNGLRLIEPAKLNDRTHHRVMAHLSPGLGLAKDDFVVLWIDAETNLLSRVHFTMRGLDSTKSAHVDVTFDRYRNVEGFPFPTDFVERVRYPVPATAHEWYATELEVRRQMKP